MHLDLIIRYELLIVSLLQRGILYLHEDNWKFSLLGDSDSEELFKIAINDVMNWLEHLCGMAMIPWQKPDPIFCDDKGAVQIDCNLFRFPDGSSCGKENKTIFIRNDPYIDRDWFKLSLAKPISYEINNVKINSVTHNYLDFFLENIFGYKKFQTGQLPIIKEALSLSDTIGILPTSGGKSLCYQLACLLQPCINFVICPLVSLCHDQKYNLDLFNITRTAEITSNIQTEKKHQAIKDLENGKFFFVWITPERFQSAEFRRNICNNNKLHFCYAVLDEVHCLSEWGHDFRTAYLLLVRTLHKLVPETCLIGLTATISSFVLLDLMREFQIDISRIVKSKNLDRDNLRFEVDIVPANKREDIELFALLDSIQKKYRDSIFSANSKDPFGGIIFCNNATGKNNSADSVYQLLQGKYKGDIGIYHSKIDVKDQVQQKFIENKLRILTATKAFGMGVNKKNIRYTIHYGLPQSIEDFYQEAGRAGRDQKEAVCTIIYHQEPLQNKKIIEECFGINTPAERVFQLKNNFRFDLQRVFYLLSKNYRGIEKDYLFTCNVLDELQSPQNTNSVLKFINDESTHNDVYPFSKIDTEKALYRLMILGIVDDWTIDYPASLISLQWYHISNDEIKNNFLSYIKRYDSEKEYKDFSDLSEGVRLSLISSQKQTIRNYIKALIIWQYENIYYQRRMSIKNMMDLCEEYYLSPEDFKEQICDFLTVNTVTDDLDVIADEPWNTRKWFKILKTPHNKTGPKISYSEIVRSCERYLESYQSLTGLDFVYSVSCAMCNIETEEAQIRFRSAITSIYNYFLKERIKKIHEGLFDIIEDADKDSKWWIREILIELQPELEDYFCKKISID